MFFFDAFINNQDRLTDTTCNAGNFLLDLKKIHEDNSLYLIDHDFELYPPLSSNAKENVKLLCRCLFEKNQLLSHAIRNLYNEFLRNEQLNTFQIKSLTQEQQSFIRLHMGKGVLQALNELLLIFPDKNPLITRILGLPPSLNTPLSSKYNSTVFFEVIQTLREEKAKIEKEEDSKEEEKQISTAKGKNGSF